MIFCLRGIILGKEWQILHLLFQGLVVPMLVFTFLSFSELWKALKKVWKKMLAQLHSTLNWVLMGVKVMPLIIKKNNVNPIPRGL